MKKLSNAEAELQNSIAYKESVYSNSREKNLIICEDILFNKNNINKEHGDSNFSLRYVYASKKEI